MKNVILVFIFILLQKFPALLAQNINADTIDVIQILSLPAIESVSKLIVKFIIFVEIKI